MSHARRLSLLLCKEVRTRFSTSLLFSVLSSLCLCVSVVNSSFAQTSFPMVTHVHPVALQRGKTTAVTVEGQQNFFACTKALFEGDGISAEVVPVDAPPPKAGQTPLVKNVKLKVTVA